MPPVHAALLAAWVALPVLGGGAIGDALAAADPSAAPAWSAALWAVWALGLAALAVPRTTTLTAVRLVVPGGAVLGAWTATTGATGAGDVAAATAAGAATVLVLSPSIGARFVDGSSYGDERRLPLRAPSSLLLGPIELVAALVLAGAAAGPALLLAGDVAVGLAATAGGWVVAALGCRSLHQLSRRWLVLVPAGLVVHDQLTLAEPVLLRRQAIEGVGPAPVDVEAHDLTAGAPGLALLVALAEPTVIGPAPRRGEPGRTVEVRGVLVTPTLPGATLAEAARRRLPASPG